jgi:4-amino-4-deoxy-L-arabinose transferase-like glycosyltransferase
MRSIKITRNPYVLFSPFLAFFIVWVFVFHSDGTLGDEPQYRMFAQNLLHGFYSFPAPEINLPVGPGYPIILMPFFALHLPLIYIAILNAVLYYLSIILLFKALMKIVSYPVALIFSLYWAFYYNSYREMKIIIHPEIVTSFLISLLVYCLISAYNQNNTTNSQKKYLYLSGFVLGYLVLTKIVFGYIIIALAVTMGLLWIVWRKSINFKKSIVLLLVAFVIQAPYLLYTYSLTGKMFYWGTTGGNNLYWMSNPNTGEYGDWWTLNPKFNDLIKTNPGYYDSLKANHLKDFEEYNKYNYYSPEQDQVFKRMAINNIKSYPIKFVQNCFSNIGRMLFDYPHSYRLQNYKDLLRFAHNGIIVVLAIFCMIPTLINWRKVLFPIQFLCFLVLLYLGASTLGSADLRMFTKIVPILLVWIAFVIEKTIRIQWKFDDE